MPGFQVTKFHGGINNEVKPWLIPSESAVDLVDADITGGALQAMRDTRVVPQPELPLLTNQDGNRSIVRFGNNYFWSDNRTGDLSSSLGYFGIEPPTLPLRLIPGRKGTRFTGTYKYVRRYRSRSGFQSAPFSVNTPNLTAEINADVEEKVFSTGDFPSFRPIIPFAIVPPGANAIMHYPGTIMNHLGRTWRVISAVWGVADRDQTTIYTDHHPAGSANLWEDITTQVGNSEIKASGLDSICVSWSENPPEAGSDIQFIDIYRTISNGSRFYFLQTVPLEDGEFTDQLPDSQILLNRQLDQVTAMPPLYFDQGNTFTKVGGKYLTEINERYWLAYNEYLFHSEQSDVVSWPTNYRTKFPADITGIARFGDALIIFQGSANPYFVNGNIQEGTLSQVEIPSHQGCRTWQTISYAGNAPIWQSDEGVCVATKNPQGQDPEITVITKSRYKFSGQGRWAAVNKDIYYLFFNDHTWCIDLGRDLIYKRSFNMDYAVSSHLDGKLYMFRDNRIHVPDEGDFKQFKYLSPEFSEGSLHELKTRSCLYVNADDDVSYRILIDGVQSDSGNLVKGGNDNLITTINAKNCFRLQLELQSKGTIRSYLVE